MAASLHNLRTEFYWIFCCRTFCFGLDFQTKRRRVGLKESTLLTEHEVWDWKNKSSLWQVITLKQTCRIGSRWRRIGSLSSGWLSSVHPMKWWPWSGRWTRVWGAGHACSRRSPTSLDLEMVKISSLIWNYAGEPRWFKAPTIIMLINENK